MWEWARSPTGGPCVGTGEGVEILGGWSFWDRHQGGPGPRGEGVSAGRPLGGGPLVPLVLWILCR